LSDLAGNPWGTYGQKEPCVYCGSKLVQPKTNMLQRILAKTALIVDAAQNKIVRPYPYWIHVVFRK
ncbi:MAG: hypothetical protein MN733_01930, partial [Nitrososphaera sp.]|nr:hypothetical protein [Nitrososphaera sp.]